MGILCLIDRRVAEGGKASGATGRESGNPPVVNLFQDFVRVPCDLFGQAGSSAVDFRSRIHSHHPRAIQQVRHRETQVFISLRDRGVSNKNFRKGKDNIDNGNRFSALLSRLLNGRCSRCGCGPWGRASGIAFLGRPFPLSLRVIRIDVFQEIRLARARRLPDDGNLSAAEIAQRCGRDEPSGFLKCFRGRSGFSQVGIDRVSSGSFHDTSRKNPFRLRG